MRPAKNERRGAAIALFTVVAVVVFAFAAFTIDCGYIMLSKCQLQVAADAAALAAGQELLAGLGPYPTKTPDEVKTEATQAAIDIAAMNKAADKSSVNVLAADVRLGQLVWNGAEWEKRWGDAPYNLVEVTVRRDTTSPDGPLNLFFAPVIGHKDSPILVRARTAVFPGSGVLIREGSSAQAGVLPFAFDKPTWDNMVATRIGDRDQFTHDPKTGEVTSGADGIPEVNLYPNGQVDDLPGNRGTVDIGANNNSTSDLSRQILDGLNASDLAVFNGEFDPSLAEPIWLQGDTGVSAGMKDELDFIVGEKKLIPLFDQKGPGSGNNAELRVVQLVAVTVTQVSITGNPKTVYIQPTVYSGSEIIPGKDISVTEAAFFTPVKLVD